MKLAAHLALALAFPSALLAAGAPVPGRPASLAAPDGTKLAATYYPGKRLAPGILLLHQCNRDRSVWNALAADLAGKGFHVLTVDYRGYGQSAGARHSELPTAERVRLSRDTWPGDIDVAFAYLRAQPGVRVDAIGAAGASCGVNNSIQLSRRHPEVKSLVLLSGNTDRSGRQHLRSAKTLPLFLAAADDDGDVVSVMAWIDASSGNAANRFTQYTAGGHGTDMFKAHPELPGEIVAWFELTLMGKDSGVLAKAKPRPVDPTTRLRLLMDEPGGPARAAESLAAERRKDPGAAVLAAPFVNQLGYEAIAAGDPRAAVAILQLNVDAHPGSSNAWDSLGDAYLANGQTEKAREASQKCLALVDSDASESPEQRILIRESAQQKLDRLKTAPVSM
jgi:dienelactone hydrolase